MKLLKTSMAILFAASLLTACGGKDKKTEDKKETDTKTTSGGKLEGAWEIKRAEGTMDSANIGTVYEFNGNKLTFGKGSFTNPGTTVITDSTFSFQADGNDLKFMFSYRWNGDTLVVDMQGSDQTFYMVKK